VIGHDGREFSKIFAKRANQFLWNASYKRTRPKGHVRKNEKHNNHQEEFIMIRWCLVSKLASLKADAMRRVGSAVSNEQALAYGACARCDRALRNDREHPGRAWPDPG
jgi:hypothetical protein